jgi:hypothetical protein
MEDRSISVLKRKATELGFRTEKLPSGALVFSKDNVPEIQVIAILDAYYVKYVRSGKAYVVYDLRDDVIEAIFRGYLSELKDGNVIEIPLD